MPQFTEYNREDSYTARKYAGATVTVQRRGLISFSEDTFTALGSPVTVKFLVDREARLIGIQGCRPRDKNAHAVREPQHLVSAVKLLRYAGADLSAARRYTLHVEDGLPPYIDLNEDAPVVVSNRDRRKAEAGQ